MKTMNWNLAFPQSMWCPSAGGVEYTDLISAKGQISLHECPGYDTKQSDKNPFVDIFC